MENLNWALHSLICQDQLQLYPWSHTLWEPTACRVLFLSWPLLRRFSISLGRLRTKEVPWTSPYQRRPTPYGYLPVWQGYSSYLGVTKLWLWMAHCAVTCGWPRRCVWTAGSGGQHLPFLIHDQFRKCFIIDVIWLVIEDWCGKLLRHLL